MRGPGPEQGEGVGQRPPAVAGAEQLGGGAQAIGIVEVEQAGAARAPWTLHRSLAMMKPMTTTQTPLVTREALQAFTQRLVELYAPEKVILFGSLARGEGRWDSDADILVVMPFEGRHLAKIREMRRLCPVRFPLDLLVRRPEEIAFRYRGGDPVVREAIDDGEVLHG